MILPSPFSRARVRLRPPRRVLAPLALALLSLGVFAATALAGASKPAGTLTATAGNGGVSLSWGPSQEATGNTITYKVYRQTGTAGGFTNIASTTNTLTYADAAVTAGTSYSYKVTATRTGGSTESGFSNTVTVTATGGTGTGGTGGGGTTPPPPPTAATVEVDSSGNKSFSPTTTTIATGGTVTWHWNNQKHNVTANSGQSVTFSSGDKSTGTFVFTFAAPGNYRYNCTLHGGMTGTIVVQDASAPADTTPPSKPGLPTATAGDGHVILDWADSTDNTVVTGYRVYRKTAADPGFPTLPQLTPSASVVDDAGLTNGTAYTYQVVAVDAAGNQSAPSDPVSATPAAATGGPAQTASVDVGFAGLDVFNPTLVTIAPGGTVTWTWAGRSHNVTSDVAGQFASATQSNGTFTQTFPTAGTFKYHCTLHSGMNGTIQVAAAPPPPDTAAPTVPANLTVTPGDGENVLNWTASTDNTAVGGYDVYRRTAGTTTWPTTPLATVTANLYLDTGLTNGTAYEYRVVAFDVATPANRSAASAVVSGTPAAAPAGGGPAGAVTVEVGANGLDRFTAPTVTVTPGATVTWHWNGNTHNVTSTAAGDTFASANLSTGTYTHTYNSVGTFAYRCTLHSGMTGVVQVATAPPPPDTTAPSAPTGLTVTPGDAYNGLSWTASTDNTAVDHYEVFRQTAGATTWPLVPTASPTVTEQLDTGLTNGTTYSYKVVAVDLAGNRSTASAVVSGTPVAPTVPSGPPATATVQVGDFGSTRFNPQTTTVAVDGTVTWNWNGSLHNVTFSGPGANFASPDLSTGTWSHTFATAGTYTYVCTFHANMSGTISVQSTTTVDTTPPSVPATPTATAGDGSVSLDWADNPAGDGVTSYDVYRQNADGTWPTTPVDTPATSSYVDTAVTNGTTYTYRIVAADAAGNTSAPSATAQATPTAPPPVDPGPSGPGNGTDVQLSGAAAVPAFSPTSLTVTPGATVTWHWNGAAHNVTSAPGEPQTLNSGNLSTGTWSHTFATAGTYHYVCTLHSGMTGTVVVQDATTPADTTPPDAPGAPTAVANDGSVTLDWPDSTATDLDKYNVYRQAAGGGWSIVASPTISAAQDSGLQNGTSYTWRVTAVDTAGNESAPSATASATPVAPVREPRTTTVSVGNNTFTNDDIQIDAGDTVKWVWDAVDTNHTVTSDPGQADSFESHPGVPVPQVGAPAGNTFSHVFDTPGTYTYLCRVHPNMVGTVRVGPDAKGGGGNSGRGNGANDTSGPGSGTGDTAGPSGPVAVGAGGQTRVVDIANYTYSPATVNAVTGDVVHWQWTGSDKNHTVTSLPGAPASFESHPGIATLKVTTAPAGGYFEKRFDVPGTYDYFCRLHPDMKATVVVRDRAAAAAATAADAARRAAAGAAPKVTKLKVKATRRSAAVLTLHLSSNATITVAAKRQAPGSKTWRTFKGVTFKAKAGAVRHRWRVLPRGSYRLTITAVDAKGAKTTTRVTVTVR